MKLCHFLLPLGVFFFLANSPAPRHPTPPLPPPPVAIPVPVVIPEPLPISQGIDQSLRIPVGPPDAILAAWVLEPAAGTPIQGTVLFLHGFMATHLQLQNAGEALRKAGYRAVMLDARGFGMSTGAHYTFGVLDAHDLSQVVDALQAKKLCGKTVGVYGTSMGAATAILFAGSDPRVTTAVAVASFADIREEVPAFSRQALGSFGALFNDNGLNALANVVGDWTHMDLDDAKPIDAISKTKAQVLLIHGDADSIIPDAASDKLHAAAAAHSKLVKVPDRGHLDLCFDFRGELQPMTRDWFDRYLKPR